MMRLYDRPIFRFRWHPLTVFFDKNEFIFLLDFSKQKKCFKKIINCESNPLPNHCIFFRNAIMQHKKTARLWHQHRWINNNNQSSVFTTTIELFFWQDKPFLYKLYAGKKFKVINITWIYCVRFLCAFFFCYQHILRLWFLNCGL